MTKQIVIIGGLLLVGFYLLHRSHATGNVAAAANIGASGTGNAPVTNGLTGQQQVVINATDQIFGSLNSLFTGNSAA